ncbi:hypothetical protein ACVCII_24145 [Burkholderia glumae]|uniref:hypothetical protein n=1 Tax=Burkholderia glumae TaxID=337 RepID=UPI002037655F|nr:hypothetical protein [Burkholderia glumae]MCM2543881.1 hypothetical protein [Burkholderia glumae]
MSESNQAAYNRNVLGVAKFSGEGVVFQNARPRLTGADGSYDEGHINIDVGTGWISCQSAKMNDFSDLKRGDRVRVSGSIGGAMSWQVQKDALGAITGPNGAPWRAGYEYLPKDSITLLTSTCLVEKVR